MSLSYTRYYHELNQVLCDANDLLSRHHSPDVAALSDRVERAAERLRESAPLRLILIGEFSSGKSSIVSALTGADLIIDADVATDRVSEHALRCTGLIR